MTPHLQYLLTKYLVFMAVCGMMPSQNTIWCDNFVIFINNKKNSFTVSLAYALSFHSYASYFPL